MCISTSSKPISPFERWTEYPTEVLNYIDIHLNVLVHLLGPSWLVQEDGELSVRQIPPRVAKSMAHGTFDPESLSGFLPGWISEFELWQLICRVLEYLGIELHILGRLLIHENDPLQPFYDSSSQEIKSKLLSFAKAQLNWESWKELCLIPSGFPIFMMSDETRTDAESVRRQSMILEEESMDEYMTEWTLGGRNGFNQDFQQLEQDIKDYNLGRAEFETWSTCLHFHWFGPVPRLPNYLQMLNNLGFNFGCRIPVQFENPREPKEIFSLVAEWVEHIHQERKFIREFHSRDNQQGSGL